MVGKPCVGAMSARACHRYHSDVASKGWLCLALLAMGPVACSDPDSSSDTAATVATSVATTGAPITSVPVTSVPLTSVQVTGVPGLAASDPFCAAWSAYAGTLQALGVAGS